LLFSGRRIKEKKILSQKTDGGEIYHIKLNIEVKEEYQVKITSP
jgi:hypothetical protein